MPKLVMQDDCFAPYGKMELKYKGPDPFGIYKKAHMIIREVFELEDKDVWERDFRWDTTEEPRSFFVRIIANRGFDIHSDIKVEFVFQGVQPSDPTKEGHVTIVFYPRLNTNFNLDTFFKQLPIYMGFLRIYNFFFYNRVRRNYLKLCREYTQRIIQAFREVMKAQGMEDIMEHPIK